MPKIVSKTSKRKLEQAPTLSASSQQPDCPAAKRRSAPVQNRVSSPVSVSSSSSSTDLSPDGHNGRSASMDYMLRALGRIRELQDELDFLQNDPYAEDTDDEEDDTPDVGQHVPNMIGGRQAEAIGWAVCARETMHFLQREGIAPDSPLMVQLRRRLIGPQPDGRSNAPDGRSLPSC
ncbi:uncharacterized protein LOC128731729 [Anopheles nili]|uniref:uncharacterized protein LOC128731729 n=1 Tax=Anopheles nili TaxID=185578 RepID=UPI00237A1ABD|nr:uncharacterized protein LOC128731729 [Anopheles nili]